MSIQPFAQSLLSDVRKRREEETKRIRKRQERNELLGLVGGLAVKIGNEALANKTVDFLNKEPIWNAGLAQKKARAFSADIFNTESQMSQQGGEMEWTLKNMDSEFEAYLQRNLPDEITGKAGIYEEWKEQQKRIMAKDWLENEYRPALEMARKIASADDYEAMLALNAKKTAPSNLGAFITRAGANLLGGKSQKEIDVEAVDAITSGRMAKNAEKLNTFMQSYRTTGDVVRAFDIANIVFPEQELSEDEKFKINRIQKIANVDDQLIVYEQVDKEEINTGEKTTEVNMGEQAKPRVLFKPDSDPEQIKLDTMKALNTSFNFEKDGRLLLKPEAFSKFAAEATGKNLNVQSPKTVKEHNSLQAIYATYLEDPNNLQDQFRNQKTLKIFDLMVGEPEEFMNMLSSALAEDDPDKRRIGIENLAMSIAQKMILAEDLLSGKVRDYRDLP